MKLKLVANTATELCLQVCEQSSDSISLWPTVRSGVHGGGVGARVERAAQAGVQRAAHALRQERRHRRRVSSAWATPPRGVQQKPFIVYIALHLWILGLLFMQFWVGCAALFTRLARVL